MIKLISSPYYHLDSKRHLLNVFTYQPAGNGARNDVTINDSGPAGCTFARTCGPVRRTPVPNLLVCRQRRQKTSLTEFLMADENKLTNKRPYETGHNRLYHHTETCLPFHPKELDIDSKGESDPLWLRQKTKQMIDEFSDVNAGEKELMRLWNLHVMKHGFVGDCELPLACEMFLEANGREIIRKNLYRNCNLHLSSLFDSGLISRDTVYKAIQKLQEILSKYPEGQTIMPNQRANKLKYWSEVGRFKHVEQKLKTPQKYTSSNGNRSFDGPPGSATKDDLNSSQESINGNCNSGRSVGSNKRTAANAVKRSSNNLTTNHNDKLKIALNIFAK